MMPPMDNALRIDLNCDLGEGAGNDEALMPLITSANIACGAHAGDEQTMRATVRLAIRHGVAIGAHPGFADHEHFGRRELALAPAEIVTLVRGQVETLRKIAREEGAVVGHVKPHGALYNVSAREPAVAAAIAEAVASVDAGLALFGLAGSVSLAAGRARGLRVVAEVFADRTYQADGSLTPRGRADALIEDPATAVNQVLRMIRERTVRAIDGTDVAITADTVCLHGDGAEAVTFALGLREALSRVGVHLRPIS
jgi:UPF0271 protein